MPHGHQCPGLFVQIQYGIHHKELLFHGDTGVVFMECVLLKESEADDAGDLQYKLLVVRKYVASDQFDDLKKAALLV